MTFRISALAKGALAAALAAGALTAGTASAAVVCNGAECWHVRNHYDYPAGVGVTWHANNWAWRHRGDYQWRHDRFDRGYYRNGVWISF